MKIYGLTIVHSDGSIVAEDMNGTSGYRESITKLFTSREDVISYALSAAEEYFDLNDEFSEFMDGEPEASDDNGYTLADIKERLAKGEDDVIQYSSYHIEFNFFSQEVEI